jgi:sulfate transport system ATP-binding protein
MSISVRNISKQFGKTRVVDDVSLDIPTGALLALLGPSGSGKTTLLRILAGLEIPDAGTVHYQDEDATHRSARERNVGFVFQHYALFRHLSVFENIAFGLRVRHWSRQRIKERVNELLELIQLGDLAKRFPSQLSGGQRQRVALARALAPQPRVLLLDEPFGALDARVRQELRQWLRRLHNELHVTSIFVTHDQDEAFEVADKVVVMHAGRVEQVGSPMEVFEHPANAFVMQFLGNVNVFPVRVQNGKAFWANLELDYTEVGSSTRPPSVFIRPHDLEISHTPNGVPSLEATVVQISPAGSVAKVRLQATGVEELLSVDLSPATYSELGLQTGDTVYVFPRKVRVFAPEYAV